MVGGRRECIKLYGVTTPVTNSFIQCKSIHKEHHSCVRGAPGKGGCATQGEKNENFKNVYFSLCDSTCLDMNRGDALSRLTGPWRLMSKNWKNASSVDYTYKKGRMKKERPFHRLPMKISSIILLSFFFPVSSNVGEEVQKALLYELTNFIFGFNLPHRLAKEKNKASRATFNQLLGSINVVVWRYRDRHDVPQKPNDKTPKKGKWNILFPKSGRRNIRNKNALREIQRGARARASI